MNVSTVKNCNRPSDHLVTNKQLLHCISRVVINDYQHNYKISHTNYGVQ